MKCARCGTEYPDTENGCPACGFGAAAKLMLRGPAGELSTTVDLDVGKTLGAKIVGPDSKYMDDVQFMLRYRDDKWYVKPYPRVKNPLYVNGSALACETELSDGDKLSLKGKAGFMDVVMA